MSKVSIDLAPSRRRFIRNVGIGAGALALPGLVGACGSAAKSAAATPRTGALAHITSKQVIFADFGGTTRTARTKAFFDSFTQETGVQVVSSLTANAVQAEMENGGSGPYDGIPASLYELYADLPNHAVAALPSDVTRSNDIETKARPYAWAAFIIAYAQGYLPKSFPGGGPQTWADFWDVKKFPGKRAWPGSGYSFDCTIEAALLADGVPPDKLYPLDFARGFAKLSQLRPHMVFYTEFPQVQQFLVSGTASIGFAPHGLFVGLKVNGVDTTVVMNEALQVPNISFTSPKSPHKDAAFGLAQWMTDGRRQADFAARTGYGPGNVDAFQYMPDSVLKMIPNSPANSKITITLNNTSLKDSYSAYFNGYTKWLSA